MSGEDATDFLPGWTCVRLEKPLPGTGPTAWATMWKLVRLIESVF